MKNIFSPFAKLVAMATFAISLGSCSRAEYAMLPKSSSYHGVTRAATPVPATQNVASATPAPAAAAVKVALETPETNATATAPAVQASAQVPDVNKKALSGTVATATAGVPNTAPALAAAPAPKLSLVQRLALNKVTHKVDKLIQKSTARQHDNTASTARGGITGNLRTGLIFLLVGLLLSLFSGISGIFGVIGGILAIIGLVFIILWLLDEA